VGGDFFDVILLSKKRVGLIMADVSDKGMPAALYMALTRSLLRVEARRSSSPRKVLLNVHRLLLEMSQADMFVTVFYGVLDLEHGKLRYTLAGHDRPLLFSPTTSKCQFLTGKGTALGFIEKISLEEVHVDLRAGDLLILYTDGITDANSQVGEFFGVERLRQTVCAGNMLDASDMCDHIFEQTDRFQAGAAQHDDMALLVVKAHTIK
jgi:sigma-B regulation protein RsbU (phosphoserine phosphatase)